MKIFVFLWLFFSCSLFSLEVEDILRADGGFFKNGDADVFLAANSPYRRYFRWVSDEKREARYPAWSNTPRTLTYAGHKIPEVIFRFRKDRSLKSIYLSLYNRGDSGPMEFEQFEKLLERHVGLLEKMSGEEPQKRRAVIDAGMRAERRIWVHGGLAYILRSSYTAGKSRKRNIPEYLQLEIEVYDPEHDPRKESMKRTDRSRILRRRDLPRNLVTQRNGTVFIDHIPMVDQGSKGYCVVATLERVLRYFGIDHVTQHGLAQIAGSSAQEGTSIDEMLDAFRKAGGKLGVVISEKYNMFRTARDVERMVKYYNRAASHKKEAEKIRMVRSGRSIDIMGTYRQMDPEIYMQSRNQKSLRKEFSRIVQENIDDGVPILWCMLTGLAQGDRAGKPFAPHLRLIIGYNARTGKIIYSDSWGAGHEKKEMGVGDACAVTYRMLVMKPRQ